MNNSENSSFRPDATGVHKQCDGTRIIIIQNLKIFQSKTKEEKPKKSHEGVDGRDDVKSKEKRRKRKERGLIDDDSAGAASFSCFCCNMVFSSEKGLHGHMRTHPMRSWRGIRPPVAVDPSTSDAQRSRHKNKNDRKDLKMLQQKEREAVMALLLLACDDDQREAKMIKEEFGDAGGHRCIKCGKKFESGQSLGGHMRAHYHDEQGETKKVDIDLNAMPEKSVEE